MIKINWVITDDLSDVSLKEFDNEWNGIISGYFELIINRSREGFCPQRKINKDEEGVEDVLYWLSHLSEGIGMLKKGKQYEMILLTMNLYKMVMKNDEGINIYFINKKDNTIKWHEKITLQEFEDELNENINRFIQMLKENNPELLESKWVKRMINL